MKLGTPELAPTMHTLPSLPLAAADGGLIVLAFVAIIVLSVAAKLGQAAFSVLFGLAKVVLGLVILVVILALLGFFSH